MEGDGPARLVPAPVRKAPRDEEVHRGPEPLLYLAQGALRDRQLLGRLYLVQRRRPGQLDLLLRPHGQGGQPHPGRVQLHAQLLGEIPNRRAQGRGADGGVQLRLLRLRRVGEGQWGPRHPHGRHPHARAPLQRGDHAAAAVVHLPYAQRLQGRASAQEKGTKARVNAQALFLHTK